MASFQRIMASVTRTWGLTVSWEHAAHCPFIADDGQVCAKNPVWKCPVCDGQGATYGPPTRLKGFFADFAPTATHDPEGQKLVANPTLVISPGDPAQLALLQQEGVYRQFEDLKELADRFIIRSVPYYATAPAMVPALRDEILQWKVPLRRDWGATTNQV